MTEGSGLEALLIRYHALVAAGRPREMLAVLEAHGAEQSGEALYWTMLGRCLCFVEDWEHAEAAARTACELAPEDLDATVTLLLALSGRGEHDDAVRAGLDLVAQHPQDPQAHYWAGAVHFDRRRTRADVDIAHRAAVHALTLGGDDPAYYGLGAQAAHLLDDSRQAKDLLHAGLARHPQDRDLLLLDARLAESTTPVARRTAGISSALTRNPLDPSAQTHLADQVLMWVRNRLLVGWFAVIAAAAAVALPGRALAVGAAAGLVLVHLGWTWRSVRQLSAALPASYLREQLGSWTRGGPATALLAGATALGSAGSLWAAADGPPGSSPGLWLMISGAALTAAGLQAVDHAAARLWADPGTDPDRAAYRLQRFRLGAEQGRVCWCAVLLGIAVAVLASGCGHPPAGGTALLAVALVWGVRAIRMVLLSLRPWRAGGPWATGTALSHRGARPPSRLYTTWLAFSYCAVQLWVTAFATVSGVALLTSTPTA